nr:MAG TPA: hypothetical protein [Caudoviricetes sp.]
MIGRPEKQLRIVLRKIKGLKNSVCIRKQSMGMDQSLHLRMLVLMDVQKTSQ